MIKVGQILREERVQKGFSVDEVAKATKIRPAFIESIEKGDYNKLPPGSYTQGFVKNYASFLGLPEKETLARFRREFNAEKEFRVLPHGLPKTQEFPLKRIRLQQTALVLGVIFLTVIVYLLFQYKYLFINPPLTIQTPEDGNRTTSTIVVSGTTDANATVYINNDPVTVHSDGSFTKTLDLFPGKSTIVIKSINRFGKETTSQRTVTITE